MNNSDDMKEKQANCDKMFPNIKLWESWIKYKFSMEQCDSTLLTSKGNKQVNRLSQVPPAFF